jgi:hypothetical protein
VFGFVDDFRQAGNSAKEAWLDRQQVASKSNHLGIQDAPRKRRDGSSTPGAWTGSIVWTGEDGVFLLISADKWDKIKALLREMQEMLVTAPKLMRCKRLEQIRGFLNYVAKTYTWLRPYLIGVHMTIDGWRPNQDGEGWRTQSKLILFQEDDPDPDEDSDEWMKLNVDLECPEFVKAVPRLASNVEAMVELCSAPLPPKKRV